LKRVSVRFRGTSKRARPGRNYSFVIHDFRLYTELGMALPEYIVPDRIKENRIVYLAEELRGRENDYYEIIPVLEELEKEQKEALSKLKEKGHSVPHTFKHTFAQVIITFSAETRKEILEGELSVEQLSEKAEQFFLSFSKVFGVKPLYLVLHLDETSPHFHGLTTNVRTYNMFSNPLDDPEVLFLAQTYLPEDVEKIYLGVGKTLTGSIKDTKRFKEPPYYAVDIRHVQDFAGKIFAPLQIFRGLPREARMNAGEPFWKWLHRSVNRLHYDLPMEIKLKEEQLAELKRQLDVALASLKESVELVKKLKSQKKELQEELERLQKLLKMKEEEFYKFLEEEKLRAVRSIEEEIKQKNIQLQKTETELQKTLSYTNKLKSLLKKSILKLKSSQEKVKEKEKEYLELLKKLKETKEELTFLSSLKNRSEDEINLYKLALSLSSNPDELTFSQLRQNPLFHLSELLTNYYKLYTKYSNLPPSPEKEKLYKQLSHYRQLLSSTLKPYKKTLHNLTPNS